MDEPRKDIESLMQDLQKALNEIQGDDAERVPHLDKLASFYLARYEKTELVSDLSTAIQYLEQALKLTANDGSTRIDRLATLGDAYMDKWRDSWLLEDIDFAIHQFEQAIDIMPEEDSRLANWLGHLGDVYLKKYYKMEDPKDLDYAIDRYQMALESVACDDPDRAKWFQKLGDAYNNKHVGTETPLDVQLAIYHYQQALNLTPPDYHAERAYLFKCLGSKYLDRYREHESLDDAKDAINMFQAALDYTPEDSPDWAFLHTGLGNGYEKLYNKTEELEDLQIAIRYHEESLRCTPIDHPERVNRLNSLGAQYQLKHLQSNAMKDLEPAIEIYKESLTLTSDSHPLRSLQFNVLGITYSIRYRASGTLDDLDLAIQALQRSATLARNDFPNKVDRVLSLALTYKIRFDHSKALIDLRMAKQQYEKALILTPYDHPTQADRLEDLGKICLTIYKQNNDSETLKSAIKFYQDALELTSSNSPERLERLLMLESCRYNEKGVLTDFQPAIQSLENIVHLPSEDPSSRVYQIERLGAAYNDMYERTGSLQAINKSIELYLQALNLTSPNNRNRVNRLQLLGDAYRGAYKKTRDPETLKLSIERLQEAIDLTQHDDSFRIYRLKSLGFAYERQYELTKAHEDFVKVINIYHEGFHSPLAGPSSRLLFGKRMLVLYGDEEDWQSAYEVASLTIPLITLLTPRSLELSDRQNLVTQIVGLASDAAAIAIKAEKSVYTAIEFLENGRSIISSAVNDIRTDISQLRQNYPQLARRFDELRNILDDSEIPSEEHIGREAARELEKLVSEIRDLPYLNRFLLPPSEEDLKVIAQNGPIVLVNVSEYGCHAFIVEKQKLQALELADANKWVIYIKAELLGCPSTELLEWLWDTIANPVLMALGYTDAPTTEIWPRIWWIPTGRLTRFPLHAAGYHDGSQARTTVIDRVISSYASSVKALNYGRSDGPNLLRTFERKSMVVVGMEHTPGHLPLRFALQETEALADVAKTMKMELRRPAACRDDVLAALSRCQIFHFAGHGHTDLTDPSQSALVLSDGRLTVESILKTNLHQHKPFLAYLSACGTGRVRNDELTDEGFHLIGACQLAGFQHVIGTLWEVDDKSCVNVAKTTYQWIKQQSSSDVSVSEGLHHAIRNARDKWVEENTVENATSRGKGNGPIDYELAKGQRNIEAVEDTPMYWVPYVHYGI